MAKSKKTAQICKKIIDAVASGLSLRKACLAENIAASSFIEWLYTDQELTEQYIRARETGLDKMADDLLEIADKPAVNSEDVQNRKLQVDTRKWLLSKMAPKKYGDKVIQEISGPDGAPVSTTVTVEFIKKGE